MELFLEKERYDVVVIGGGHAGCEAALASARMGLETALVTLEQQRIAVMSCNPSVGGVGKGQLVKEIDALGGEMGKVADETAIQFRRLNTRKGSAVHSSRCQSDKRLYAQRMQAVLSGQSQLGVIEAEVKGVVVENDRVQGVQVRKPDGRGLELTTGCAVITTGTFMQAIMHCGEHVTEGGRFGDRASLGLSGSLGELGFRLLRLKTGTPPRLLESSLDFSSMIPQNGDDPPRPFSFSQTTVEQPQVPCYLGATNERTHEIIRQNLDRSPLFSGKIKGIGPRYCPSIEDKVVKFPQKPRHHVFFEPQTLTSGWIYPNGISTSLPADVQEKFVRSMAGCEEAEILRFGYAVEYDCIDPTQLKRSLEAVSVEGLFFAGQVNGTSGYEEAAAQGLVAGINASLKAMKAPPFHLDRTQAYIGVMIDDLISHGVTEPYRMFTSRAEFRLSLREDNADLRLRPYGRSLGLVSDEDYRRFQERERKIKYYKEKLRKTYVQPSSEVLSMLHRCNSPSLKNTESLYQLLKRPEIALEDIISVSGNMFHVEHIDLASRETLEVEIKYEGYIQIQKEETERLKRMRGLSIPDNFEYQNIAGLSIEVREKLGKARPDTLADAARVSGVTPAALSAILFSLRKRGDVSGSPTI